MDEELRSLFNDEDNDDDADDLMAAFSGDPLNDDLFAELDGDIELGDDPFAALDEPLEDDAFANLTAPAPLVAEPLVPVEVEEEAFEPLTEPPTEDMPEWLRDLGVEEIEEEPLPAPVTAETPVAELPPAPMPQPRRGGMTPQQRMVLALFFFLDVLVLGFLILVVMGIVQI
jgi:hypothetical protein